MAIGLLKDDPGIMRAAAAYIEHHALVDARWTKQAWESLSTRSVAERPVA